METPEHTPVERPAGSIPEAGWLGRWIDRGGLVFATGIVLSVLILMNEVILRYVFNAPTIWAHETVIFLCGIAFVYGGLYCCAQDRHIRVVLIYDAIPRRIKRIFDTIISIICAAASAMFSSMVSASRSGVFGWMKAAPGRCRPMASSSIWLLLAVP